MWTPRIPRWKRAWRKCAAPKASWRRSARRITRRAIRSTWRRASCTKPRLRSASWRRKFASWWKTASVPSNACSNWASSFSTGTSASSRPKPSARRWRPRTWNPKKRQPFWRRRSKSRPCSCPIWRMPCARLSRSLPNSVALWCRCSSRSRCWPLNNAASTSRRASRNSDANGCWPIARRWLRPRPPSCCRSRPNWSAVRSSWRSCRHAWPSCRTWCRNWMSSVARRSRP